MYNYNKNIKMSEVQAHGFSWEKEILAIYGATPEEVKNINYTSKMDLPASLNRIDNCDLSIKTTGNKNSVCMADCLRVFDMVSGQKIHLVVVHYKQVKEIKQVVHIVEIDLTNSRELLFGTLTRAQIELLDSAVKSIPQKRKPTSEEHKHMYAIKKELQKLSGAIRLDIKCNSQQSRLQCSFNKFQSFIENNPRIIEKSNTNEFRGGSITKDIISCCRKFKPK
jgi:hypothetical protein